jgi:hypothetical protein
MMTGADSATVTGIDSYTGNRRYSLTQIQTGYWIVSPDQVKYSPDLGGTSRIKYPVSITVFKQ